MEINHEVKDGIVYVVMTGRLDAVTAPDAEMNIQRIMKETQADRMVFDMSGIDYLSSAGLRVVLSSTQTIKRSQGQIVFCCLKPYVKQIFEVSGFDALIPIADTVASGVQSFS